MHNMSIRSTAFRAMASGGARGIVDQVRSGHLLQEMVGGFMKNEHRDNVEHFEPFGFTASILPKNGAGMAEAMMNFVGGSRAHAIASVISDRRYRPRGLQPGESGQYDDIGQMTLLRRTGLYLLSMDGQGGSTPQEGGQQQTGGGGGGGQTQQPQQQQNTERMVSLRHVQKSQQPAVTPNATRDQQQQLQQQQQNYKHEGETVNTEVRCTKGKIEFRTGDTVVGVYDVASKTWHLQNCEKIIAEANTEIVVGIKDKRYIRIRKERIDLAVKNPTDEAPAKVLTDAGASNLVYARINDD